MGLLELERETLERYLPGLDAELARRDLMEMEKPGNDSIRLFREAGGAGLVIPPIHKGKGAAPLDAVRVQRAIGSRSPSLGAATTMHHFSVATLVEAQKSASGMEWMLLEAIASENLLVASGFAEGRTGQSTLKPTMQAEMTPAGLRVSGKKKPCSLAHSMDLLTASVLVPGSNGEAPEMAVALIPARGDGVERRPFWASTVLAGAESDEVVLTDVPLTDDVLIRPESNGGMHELQTSAFLWFELLISGTYLGVASALLERLIAAGKGEPVQRAEIGTELEGAMMMLEGLAATVAGPHDEAALARSLFVRYAVNRAVERATARTLELLGGMAFIKSPETAQLFAAAHAIAFHPPSRASASGALDNWMAGHALDLD